MQTVNAIEVAPEQMVCDESTEDLRVRYVRDLRRLLATLVRSGTPITHPLWKQACREWRAASRGVFRPPDG